MDAKDLKTETALSEHSNHANANNYGQNSLSFQIEDKNKSYHDRASNSLSKVDIQTTRPCAVIGPDRILPQPVAVNNPYIKQPHAEPWQFPRPPEYPQKFAEFQNLSRNISPRQTFQENMQRIMVPSRSMKTLEDTNFANEKSDPNPKNFTKINLPAEGKYCDVPYTVNSLTNDQKSVRNSVSNVNPTLMRSAWPPSGVTVRPTRPFGAPELYQYPPDYTNCTGPHALPVRPFQAGHDDSAHMYSDPYRGGNIRYEPYPTVRDRNIRYEYMNYSNPFPTSHFPPHKYDPQKLGGTPGISPQGYPGYPQIPVKYLREPHGYQRSPNPQPNYNVPYHNQGIHPNYGSIPGNCLPNKLYPYSPDGTYNAPLISKPTYDSNKQFVKYDSVQTRHYPPENMYLNELPRSHQMKPPMAMPNSMNMPLMPSYPCYRKDNLPMRHYDLSVQFKNMDPSYNTQISRIPSQFSPADSHITNENPMFAISPEDCGYASQSSTTSVRSTDSGINMFHRYSHMNRASPIISRHENDSNNLPNKNKKGIDVRQFLQMWNEGDDENNESNPNKDIIMQSNANDAKLNSELYVLGLVNVPSEELGKYEHIQKVSKLPDNIKGYTSIDLLNQFEEAIESSNMSNYTVRTPNISDNQIPFNGNINIKGTNLPNRPLSPLDVESRISQSVIHKEVGCNFEIKPCSPKMLNVEVAAPVKTLLEERAIEKVTNQLVVKSPNVLKEMEESVTNCHVIKRQNRRRSLSRDDNTNISSCKMSKTQYSIDRENDKSNYSIQDLESNSGVCLASLPRLDNDIELNFPEVNQQFINANRVEPDGDSNSILAKKLEIKNIDSSSTHDVEQPKLSKYRKNKGNKEPCETSHSILQATRTDSVIIKNPESSDNIADENSTSTFTDSKIKFKGAALPINLAVNNICTKKASKDVSDVINNENLSNSNLSVNFNGQFCKEMSSPSPPPLGPKKSYDIPGLIVSNHGNDFSKSCLHNVECLKEKEEKIFLSKSNATIPIMELHSENELENFSNLLPKNLNVSSDFSSGKASSNNTTVSIFNKDSSLEILSKNNKENEISYEDYSSDTDKNDADQRARHEKLYRLLEERVNDLPENLLTPLSESTINDGSQDGFISENEIDQIIEFNKDSVNKSNDSYNKPKVGTVEFTNVDNLPERLDSNQNSNYYDFTEIHCRSKQEVAFNTETNFDYQQTENSAMFKNHVEYKHSDSPQTDNQIYDETKKSPARHGSFVRLDKHGEETEDSNNGKHEGQTENAAIFKNHVNNKHSDPPQTDNQIYDETKKSPDRHGSFVRLNKHGEETEDSNNEKHEGQTENAAIFKNHVENKHSDPPQTNNQIYDETKKSPARHGSFVRLDKHGEETEDSNNGKHEGQTENAAIFKNHVNNKHSDPPQTDNQIYDKTKKTPDRHGSFVRLDKHGEETEDSNNAKHEGQTENSAIFKNHVENKHSDPPQTNNQIYDDETKKSLDRHGSFVKLDKHGEESEDSNHDKHEGALHHNNILKEELIRSIHEDQNNLNKENLKHEKRENNSYQTENLKKELSLKINTDNQNDKVDSNEEICKVDSCLNMLKEEELNQNVNNENQNSQIQKEELNAEKNKALFKNQDILEEKASNVKINYELKNIQNGKEDPNHEKFLRRSCIDFSNEEENNKSQNEKVDLNDKKCENQFDSNDVLKEESNQKMYDEDRNNQDDKEHSNQEICKSVSCNNSIEKEESECKFDYEDRNSQIHKEDDKYAEVFYNQEFFEEKEINLKINCEYKSCQNDKEDSTRKNCETYGILEEKKFNQKTHNEDQNRENNDEPSKEKDVFICEEVFEENQLNKNVYDVVINIQDHDVEILKPAKCEDADEDQNLNISLNNEKSVRNLCINDILEEERLMLKTNDDDLSSRNPIQQCHDKQKIISDLRDKEIQIETRHEFQLENDKIMKNSNASDKHADCIKICQEEQNIVDTESENCDENATFTSHKEKNIDNTFKVLGNHISFHQSDVEVNATIRIDNALNKIQNKVISDQEIIQVKKECNVCENEDVYEFYSNDKQDCRLEVRSEGNNLYGEHFDYENVSMEKTDDTNYKQNYVAKDKNNTNVVKESNQVTINVIEYNIGNDSVENVTNIDAMTEKDLVLGKAKKDRTAPVKDLQNITYCSKNVMVDAESDNKIYKNLKGGYNKSLFNFHKELYSVQIQKLFFYQEGCVHESEHKLLEHYSESLKSTDANDLQTTNAFISPKCDQIELFNEKNTSKLTFQELNADVHLNVDEKKIINTDSFIKKENLDANCSDTYLKKYFVSERSNVVLNADQSNILDDSIISKCNMKSSTSKYCTSESSNDHNTIKSNQCTLNNTNTNMSENKLLLNITNKPADEAEHSLDNLTDLSSVPPSDSVTICSECPSNTEYAFTYNPEYTRKENNAKCFESYNLPFFTRRSTLKRALSESALYTRFDESLSNKALSWPNKRKKIDQNVNDDSISNETTACSQNRRNSISSVYHEENISFCILIDNNCLITQDDYAEGTVCFADIQEGEGITSIVNNEFESHDIQFETVNSSPDYESSQLSDTYPVECVNYKDEENWVEDVACVETVVSDDVIEENDEVPVEQYSSQQHSSDRFDHTRKLKNIYGDEMCRGDINLIKTLYATPQMDMNKTLQDKESLILECTKQYDTDCLESILSDDYLHEPTNNDTKCNKSDVCSMNYPNDTEERLTNSDSYKNNVFFDNEKLHNREKCLQENLDGLERELSMNFQDSVNAAEDDIAHSCESTVSEECCLDQSVKRLKYKRSSSSPEVSSTTEEKKTGILLKITNYNGSRISQIDNVDLDDNKRIRCKFTERNGYSDCKNDFNSHRPLLTKAAQKYIPPIKETISNLKVKLFLPPHSLMKLKKMKICQEPKSTLQKHLINGKANFINTKLVTVKKPKPKFEDVLKSLDEVQSKIQKGKTKKLKSSIPKVIIKKSENGSHYASTSNKETFNPDLTGRKWQPWVFLEKNLFIDKMAVKGKTRAVYCHRKKCYILAERFQKYKSVESTKFVISQPKLESCSPGPLKYTIKLKQSY